MLSFFSCLFSAKPEARDLSFGLNVEYGIDALVRQQQWATAQALPGDALSRLLDGSCISHRYHEEVTRYAVAWYLFLAWQTRTGRWGNQRTSSEVNGFGPCACFGLDSPKAASRPGLKGRNTAPEPMPLPCPTVYLT